MKSEDRVYRVKCRNPDCPNPKPDKIFEFKPEPIFVFRGPKRRKEYQDEVFIVTCPWCGWEKRIHVSTGDPDDKIY